jgi:hypothetical protein
MYALAVPMIFISGCTSSTPAVSSTTAPEEPAYGFIEFPYLHADAGNFQLQTGETIPLTWKLAPPAAERYDFILYPLDESRPIVLGMDMNAADGAAIQLVVPPNISGELKGLAYYADGSILSSAISGTIYSGP